MQRPGETHPARSSTEPKRWEEGRQEEVKEGGLPAWRSPYFNHSTVPLKFNCSPEGMRCRQLSAKLSKLRGPAKQMHVLERETPHTDR